MPIISFSEKELLRSIIFEPNWYRVRIDAIGENAAASGKTTNYPVDATVLFNAETGSTKFKDSNGNEVEFAGAPTPMNWMFNSGAIGLAVDFMKALGVDDIKPGMRFDLNAAVGKEIDVFIENGTYNNRIQNQINHKYRKPRADVKVVS